MDRGEDRRTAVAESVPRGGLGVDRAVALGDLGDVTVGVADGSDRRGAGSVAGAEQQDDGRQEQRRERCGYSRRGEWPLPRCWAAATR